MRANRPLCHFCGEDDSEAVKAMVDGGRARRVVWSCNTCGKSWEQEPTKRDVGGNPVFDDP